MKIALDASCLASNGRGFARYLQTLLQGMETVLSVSDTLLLFSDRPIPEARVPARFRSAARVLPALRPRFLWRRRMGRAARKAGADLVHFPDNEAVACPLPVVSTVHDISPLLLPELGLCSPLMALYFKSALERIRRRARVVIAVSETLRRDLEGWWGPPHPPIRTVLHGFRSQPRTEAPQEEAPYFLFVGALEARKNLPNLLEGFLRFRALTGLPHRMLLVGETPRVFGVRGLRIPELNGVERRGALPLESPLWPSLYAGASALALVSWYETFGFPWVEAMAYDCPVIATTAGAGPEIVGDAGILADPADPDAIAASMRRALDGRDSLVQKGRARARGYTVEAMAEGTLAAYREAL